jgi:hypothetical protein
MVRHSKRSARNDVMGQKLPRSLAAVVSALPPKAAATIADRGGRAFASWSPIGFRLGEYQWPTQIEEVEFVVRDLLGCGP